MTSYPSGITSTIDPRFNSGIATLLGSVREEDTLSGLVRSLAGGGVPLQPGDIVATTVVGATPTEANGETVDVKFYGMNVGGTYDHGMGTNNNPFTGTPKFRLDTVDPGFTSAGAATIVARSVYGTKVERTRYDTRKIAGSYTAGAFVEGEVITQTGTGATAKVAIPGSSGPLLYADTWAGSPNSSGVWTGGTSGATFAPSASPVQHGATAMAPGPREFYDGTYTTVRIRLSDMIYSGTQLVSVTMLSGFYTSGVTPSAAVSAGLVINNSTLTFTKTMADWTWGHWERVTGSSFRLRCIAFQGDARDGTPVRAVKFSVTDGTNTVEAFATLGVDTSVSSNDAQSGAEYYADISLSTLTQGAVLTANFIAYPWLGDTSNYLDTSAGAAPPAALVGPRKFLNDKSNTYGVTMALVDAATGNDSTGAAQDASTYNYLTAAPFATIGKAASAIAAYNNANHSRNNVGAGIVECNDGSYNWLGSSNSYGTTPDAVITIRPSPGASAYGVKISGTSGNTNISGRTKIESIELTTTTNNTFPTANAYIWLHRCKFNSSANTPFNGTGQVIHVTQGLAPVWFMGFRGFSTGSQAWSLIRGVDLTGFEKSIFAYTMAFCKRLNKTNSTSNLIINGIVGYTGVTPVTIIYNNALYGLRATAGSQILNMGEIDANSFGCVLVQNIFENTDDSGSPLGGLASSDTGTGNTPEANFIIWHNVMLGNRVFFGYNDAGSIVKYRFHWSIRNNYFDRPANKGDVFSPGNAVRTGAWSVTNQVRGSGNFWAMTMMSVPGNFYFEYAGLSSFQPDTSTFSASDVAQFVDLQATTGTSGTVAGAGNGDYHLQSDSPLIGLPIDWVLSHDIEGNARTLGDAAGAYTYAAPGGSLLMEDGTSHLVMEDGTSLLLLES